MSTLFLLSLAHVSRSQPPGRHRRSLPVAVAGLAFCAAAHPQGASADLENEIEALTRWTASSTPGYAIAVSHDDRRLQRYCGAAVLANSEEISADTTFDVGSLSKQFVAAAVLQLCQDGAVSLDADVRTYLPELPEFEHTVRVDHLLTHTSGLRDWVGLRRLSRSDGDAMSWIVRLRSLNFEPGTEWSYSNSGYVLLKELVSRVAKMPFSAFVETNLFEPLGMAATRYVEDPQPGEGGLAQAYEWRGDWKPEVLRGDARGGGALLSTAADLVTWTRALDEQKLGPFVADKLLEPAVLANGRKLSYARGLFLDRGDDFDVIWHTGSAGAFKASMAWIPGRRLCVAVLSNAGERARVTAVAESIFDRLSPSTPEAPEAASGPVTRADAGSIGAGAGLYASEDGERLLRLVERNGLAMFAGGPSLLPASEGRFRADVGRLPFRSGDRFHVRFTSEDTFEYESMEGDLERYTRVGSRQPEPEQLRVLAGRYASAELDSVLEVEVAGPGLRIRLNEDQVMTVEPAGDATFVFRGFEVRFRHNERGAVLGLELTTPMIRNLRYTREEE